MKRLLLGLFIGLAVVLQISLLPALRPFGVVPNLVLVTVVLAALFAATSDMLVAAVLAGLLLDLVSGSGFGLWSGILVLATLVTGVMHRSGLEIRGALVAPVVVAAGTLLFTAGTLLVLGGGAANWPVLTLLGRFVVELLLNLTLVAMLKPVARVLFGGGQTRFELGG
jgi:rod shape-determining protein MreD